jgi:hypothetical protein
VSSSGTTPEPRRSSTPPSSTIHVASPIHFTGLGLSVK